ncbi:MAG: lactate dehydrogenase, partial [Zoogloeaceae bacterium]|nr:lactate dehydrogenase [Zoogloeaceae bacterium]
MNPVEIEEAVSELANQPFDAREFPFAFLAAFGNKETTIKRLRKGETNASDVASGVLQRNNIHIATCAPGCVGETLRALRGSPKTAQAKAKFILATDGQMLEAEALASGETLASEYVDLARHFGFFLPLAGIFMAREIADNPVDIRATSKLNKLYIELLRDNPEWANNPHAMNHFMARLIFCFFAEDTDIFNGEDLFTRTIEQMSTADAADTHHVMREVFRAMNVPIDRRAGANLPAWADQFPYVNGNLFSGNIEVPHFSRTARAYLLHAGHLDWQSINPDIFGSMIQAVVDQDERGQLGMHYTSVPNILKVLNPLFLDDLRAQLAAAGDSLQKLANLKKRLTHIRVFDPACGSGNFLVIAYKELRAIEAEINERRGEKGAASEIHLTNFRGIELRDFPAEIARLALIIAEFQCDVRYIGQKEALLRFLPLDKGNWITCGNALRLDWLQLCPPSGTGVKLVADDLFHSPLAQAEIDFENEGGETYICGNPPYLGSTWQSAAQKEDLQGVFARYTQHWRSLDYVAGWFMKAAEYGEHAASAAAFVATNSICQGQQVPILWPLILGSGHEIAFAHTSFKWANLAAYNAGVTVVIVGISRHPGKTRRLFSLDENGELAVREAENINAYLIPAANVVVEKHPMPLGEWAEMSFGNKPVDGGKLLLTASELARLGLNEAQKARLVRRIYGSKEFIRGEVRYCLWIKDRDIEEAQAISEIAARIEAVRKMRLNSSDKGARQMAEKPHQMREMNIGKSHALVVPRTSSENRVFLPVGLIDDLSIASSEAFALYDAPLWNMAIIASRLHRVWIATVCGGLETRL